MAHRGDTLVTIPRGSHVFVVAEPEVRRRILAFPGGSSGQDLAAAKRINPWATADESLLVRFAGA
jgi:hypothetical protein